LVAAEVLDLETQHALASDPDMGARFHLAGNEELALEVQVRLASDAHFAVKGCLAENPVAAPHVQALLARDPSESVRSHLVRRSDVLASEAQVLLAEDEVDDIRWRLACRGDLTRDALAVLAGDPVMRVRRALAANEELTLTEEFPMQVLELSRRGQELVARGFAEAGLGTDVLEALRVTWTGTLEELLKTAEEFASA
jgi:hypothetical protein